MRFLNVMGTIALVLATAAPARAGEAAIKVRGSGMQVYVCAPSPSGFAWRLKGPDAVLTDDAGNTFGRHFAGPSWQARDGSTVVGDVLSASPAPRPNAVPWLLLRAGAHAGNGVLAAVGFIARIETEGGLPPAGGCDAAHSGGESRVGYSAVYVFFPRS